MLQSRFFADHNTITSTMIEIAILLVVFFSKSKFYLKSYKVAKLGKKEEWKYMEKMIKVLSTLRKVPKFLYKSTITV
jgi:ABC-type enterochelin transport system permease subunit